MMLQLGVLPAQFDQNRCDLGGFELIPAADVAPRTAVVIGVDDVEVFLKGR
ncbi:MAG: hypothetical protein V1701_04465 [Planctomycetota bacterium]